MENLKTTLEVNDLYAGIRHIVAWNKGKAGAQPETMGIPPTIMADFNNDMIINLFSDHIQTVTNENSNRSDRISAFNNYLLSLSRLFLIALQYPSRDEYLSQDEIVCCKRIVSQSIGAIELSDNYKNFKSTLQKFFRDDLKQTGIISRLKKWEQLPIKERETVLADIAHQIYRSAQGIQDGFDDTPKAVAFSTLPKGTLGASFPTGIIVHKDLLSNDDPTKAIYVICHEALHMIDNMIVANELDDFEKDIKIFKSLIDFKKKYLSLYREFIYDNDPRERFNEEEYFCDIIMSLVNELPAKAPIFRRVLHL